jgi:hypothetical protein
MLSSRTQQGDKSGTEADKSYYAPAPAVSLPKGGGAIKGMGEKFAANPVTGTPPVLVDLGLDLSFLCPTTRVQVTRCLAWAGVFHCLQ